MRVEIMTLLGDTQKKMNGYAMLMNFRFMNLCTKAEPSALLPITINYQGEELDIEQVAQVAIPKEDRFIIIPNEQAFIFAICKGIAKAHPEFKIERQSASGEQEADDETNQLIVCIVPEVDQNRHDLIMQGIKLLADEASAKMNKVFTMATGQIVKKMMGAPVEEIDEAKQNLQETFDWYNDLCKQYREAKEKEVEDSYLRYQEKQAKMEAIKQEEAAARGEDVGTKLYLSEAE